VSHTGMDTRWQSAGEGDTGDDPRPSRAKIDAPGQDHAASQTTAALDAEWAMDWGRLLRTARQVAGLSLAELSVRTGLSKGYLSKLESGAVGAANPSRATLAALARALPAFRPVAHTLEPGLGAGDLAFAGIGHVQAAESGPPAAPLIWDGSPIRLGWRELELLAALVALDSAGLAHPVTAALLSRAIGRDGAEVTGVLDGLVAAGVVVARAPGRPGATPSYACAEDVAERVGVSRLGDLLVLGAALLAGSRGGQPPASTGRRPPP
jgi:transcriptional regulator with XRE-family HTH domain